MFREARQAWLGLGMISIVLTAFLVVSPPKSASAAEPTTDDAQPDVTNSLDAKPDDAGRGAMVLEGTEAGSILGKEVRSAADEKLGRIVDVIVDRHGITRAAVIDFGGFLGVGSKKIAVAWDILTFAAPPGGEDKITVQTTRDRLNRAPEFKDGRPITVLGARDEAARTQFTLKASEW